VVLNINNLNTKCMSI